MITKQLLEIRFTDRNKNQSMVSLSKLGELTGREWFDLDYSFIDPIKWDPFLENFLKNPLAIIKSLEIRYMNDKVGYGLFSAEKIAKNTVIGFISGEVKKLLSTEVNFDPQNPTALIESGQISYDDYGNIYIIDSSKRSNHTHYLQHLPSKDKLVELGIKNDNIATSNLSEQVFPHVDFNFTYFCANRDIEIGEIIGVSYQINMEERNIDTYCFFSKNGEIVESSSLINTPYNALLKTLELKI